MYQLGWAIHHQGVYKHVKKIDLSMYPYREPNSHLQTFNQKQTTLNQATMSQEWQMGLED